MGQMRTRQMDAAESVTMRIVEEVAEREGLEPLDLTPPLHDVIDTDALESLLSDPVSGERREGVQITFSYRGYAITVAADGEIEVRSE